ncbi:6-hydroxymethylpterin diphosphokinase MptE-like protein [Haloferax namakaokahaiae]|uniref:6-hydroxymethyl-7,8-dihydropterin pyrophosphokinase n=1 Tax=Haloferax namakaokahaiae TaxID=1748331 RepID=A0ABD5Z9P3_9EURY
MRFREWEPVYRQILDSLGFERAGDEEARDELAALARPFDRSRLAWAGETVAICGAAPSLASELDVLDDVDVVVAASSAADVVREAGYPVDLMVTDLDKNPETVVELTIGGTPVAVAAHGDNIPAVREWVPKCDLDNVLATTQAEPVGPVVNWGGFTDGDRAAFVADELGAGELRFAGWDFDDPTVDSMKAKKLRWAARLLAWLERRRGERFSILDGRRDDIDPL